MKRVVITGIGLITSLGEDVDTIWNNLISCKSGIKKINSFETKDLPCRIAGYISNDISDSNYIQLDKYLEKKDFNRNDRFIQFGIAAAHIAINDSNLVDFS